MFDDSDEDKAEPNPIPQPMPANKSSKLAELASKKRKEMVCTAPVQAGFAALSVFGNSAHSDLSGCADQLSFCSRQQQ